MPSENLLTQLTALVAEEGDRTSTAKAIAEAIRAAGAYAGREFTT